jgi:hypothetical protein
MMKRILPFALVPAFAIAQQATISGPEKAVRDRVDQFYHMLLEKKFRQAESFIQEDLKDAYYSANKPDIKRYAIKGVEVRDDQRSARVTVVTTVTVGLAGGTPIDFDLPATTTWRLEGDQWLLSADKDPSPALKTPFGEMTPGKSANAGPLAPPDLKAIMSRVLVDRTEVELTAAKPETVTITNPRPGPIDLALDEKSRAIPGLTTEIDTPHVDSLGQATVRFRVEKGVKVSDTVRITASPAGQVLEIKVTAK